MQKLRVLELFAGIGACSKALERLNIPHEIVDAIEIDKYAIKSFNVIHSTNFEPQDITKWDKDIEVDLIVGGFPCQDISLAGKQEGIIKGKTRSGLMYEMMRIVEKLKPKYVIAENVKNILSDKHNPQLEEYLCFLSDNGYRVTMDMLNACEVGYPEPIPQSRERIYMIGVRDDNTYSIKQENGTMYKKCETILNKLQEDGKIKILNFTFPKKQPLNLKLKDLLEDKVDEKYYLSDEQVNRIRQSTYTQNQRRIQEKEYCDTLCARDWKDPKCVEVVRKYGIFDTEKSRHQAGSVYDTNGLSPTLDTMQGGYRQPCVEVRDDIYSDESVKRIRSNIIKSDVMNTLTANAMQSFNHNNCALIEEGYAEKKYNDLRIRKLTPKECWRLMNFDDDDFEKTKNVQISNSQLYKMAGNSIVVGVLEAIFKELFKDYIPSEDKWRDLD